MIVKDVHRSCRMALCWGRAGPLAGFSGSMKKEAEGDAIRPQSLDSLRRRGGVLSVTVGSHDGLHAVLHLQLAFLEADFFELFGV